MNHEEAVAELGRFALTVAGVLGAGLEGPGRDEALGRSEEIYRAISRLASDEVFVLTIGEDGSLIRVWPIGDLVNPEAPLLDSGGCIRTIG